MSITFQYWTLFGVWGCYSASFKFAASSSSAAIFRLSSAFSTCKLDSEYLVYSKADLSDYTSDL